MSNFWDYASKTLPGAYQQSAREYTQNWRFRQQQAQRQRELAEAQRQANLRARIEAAKERAAAAAEEAKKRLEEAALAEKTTKALKMARSMLMPMYRKGWVSDDEWEMHMMHIAQNPDKLASYMTGLKDRLVKANKPPKPTKPTEAEIKRQMVVTPYAAGSMTRGQLQAKQTKTLKTAEQKAEDERKARLMYEILRSDPNENINLPPYEQWRKMPKQLYDYGKPYGPVFKEEIVNVSGNRVETSQPPVQTQTAQAPLSEDPEIRALGDTLQGLIKEFQELVGSR